MIKWRDWLKLTGIVLSILFVGAASGQTRFDKPADQEPEQVVNAKVGKLFQQMRENKYQRNLFPELTWEDVPSLLKIAESNTTLKSFPTNPFSSQMYEDCLEGEVALWLIEGIRKGGKFPSLNCRLGQNNNTDVEQLDEYELLETAREQYIRWWQEVGPQPTEESKEIEPFADSKARLVWR